MKKIITQLLLLITIPLFSQSWVQKSAFPGVERRAASGCSAQGKGYVMFGIKGNQNLKDVWEYSPISDSWTQKNNFPGPARRYAILVSDDTLIFGGLGSEGSSHFTDFMQYYPSTDSWSTKASYPGDAGYASFAAIYNGFVYVGGGTRLTNNSKGKDFWKYSIANDTWTSIGNLPFNERTGGVCIESNGVIYLGFGHDGTSSKKDFYAYYPSTNSWSQKSSFPGFDRLNPIYFKTSNNEIIVGGGYRLNNTALNDYYKYDPISDTWSLISSNFTNANRSLAAEFTINSVGYVIGGFDSTKTKFLNDIWAYKPPISTSIKDNKTTSINIQVFPVPARDYLILEIDGVLQSKVLFSLFDINGKLIQEYFIQENSLNSRIDLSSISTGNYIYRIKTNQGVKNGKLPIIK